ncbi:hypothetical protein JX265_001828 [Neoarthrinium moseri]|uniref:Uncharacterized protein n=1 Tax=Neoarthrinium moseri TaxID=1658444 RepID=A0A9P9WW06_9PEZI|nr:hypothetical protein JX266_010306 [Neoarthrinium moseri]KAI1880207.1 hypothetical protein JX265_001828 [Neoarthrinium moseri]
MKSAEKQSHDIELAGPGEREGVAVDEGGIGIRPSTPPLPVLRNILSRWNVKIEGLSGLEARGIARVLPEDRNLFRGRSDYKGMFTLWFGTNLCVLTLIPGLLGPLIFSLGWVDSVCIVIFANALSACGPAYMATFGAASGNRTMILSRHFMGYWPSKLTCLLNIVMQIGWGTVGAIVAGQMLSAVSGNGLSVVPGCVIGALGIGVIATLGIGIVHTYERYAWIPQACALFILVGSSGGGWNTGLASVGSSATIAANRCSFFALEFGVVVGFSAVAADLYVYYPPGISKPLVFLSTWSGLWLSSLIAGIIGVGIGTGVPTKPSWAEAYSVSSGALLLECYRGLGGLGGVCVVILALGSIANNAPATYAGANTCQVLGRYAKAIPRWVWCVILVSIELICSVSGRDNLYGIFENLLPIMSYWVCPWLAIVLEEHLLFHSLCGLEFDWTAWEDRDRLPVGLAALVSWLVGWAGALLGMSQVWYQGALAQMIGDSGGDIGAWVAIAFAGITYPPLRYAELRIFTGR